MIYMIYLPALQLTYESCFCRCCWGKVCGKHSSKYSAMRQHLTGSKVRYRFIAALSCLWFSMPNSSWKRVDPLGAHVIATGWNAHLKSLTGNPLDSALSRVYGQCFQLNTSWEEVHSFTALSHRKRGSEDFSRFWKGIMSFNRCPPLIASHDVQVSFHNQLRPSWTSWKSFAFLTTPEEIASSEDGQHS